MQSTDYACSIRPLLTEDMKVRRVSGRHQISGDGKRLYDGLAFGRPLLRIPSGRPDIVIPPRKRARLTIPDVEDEDEDEDYEDGSILALEAKEDVLGNNERQLVLHANFDEADENKNNSSSSEADHEKDESNKTSENSDSSSSDEDDDFSSQDDDVMGDELEGLLDDAEMDTDALQVESTRTGKGSKPFGTEAEHEAVKEDGDAEALSDVSDKNDREKIRKLHAAFPKSALGVCKHVFQGAKGDLGTSWVALSKAFEPAFSKDRFAKSMKVDMKAPVSKQTSIPNQGLKQAISQAHQSSSARQSRARKRSASAMESEESDSPESQPSEFSRFDHHGLPAGSIQSGKALSFMADVANSSPVRGRIGSQEPASANPRKILFDTGEETFSQGLTSTSLIDKEAVEKDESSSDESSLEPTDESSDDSSDEPGDENETKDINMELLNSKESSPSASESDSSETSDSDSSEDSEDEELPQSLNPQEIKLDDDKASAGKEDSESTSASDSGVSSSSDSDDSSDSSENEAPEEAPSKPVPEVLHKAGKPDIPYQGKLSTKLRNERRRQKNIRQRYLETGVLPAGTTIEDMQKKDSKNQSKVTEADEFEARRQKLLADISSGGIELGEVSNKSSSQANTQPSPADLAAPQQIADHAQANGERPSTAPEVETNIPELPKVAPASAESSQVEVAPRKSRLDLGAAKRMLFSNLGFRAPKTKEDEDKVRRTLLKDIRPAKMVVPSENPIITDAANDGDSESWRDKINYSARECVDEDVELSEPPFPFVQRWDPQQRISKSKGKHLNNHPRNDSQYYQDTGNSKRQKTKYEPVRSHESVSVIDKGYTQLSADVEDAVTKQLVEEQNSVEESYPDDLIALPENITSLPDLKDGVAKPGMIVAFKQLELSEATKWQPQESGYKTAIVIEVFDDSSINMTLAKRDRVRSEKRYNEDGDRIYAKFEMPDEDEEDEEDDGKLCLSYYELFSPKIVVDFSTDEEHDMSTDGGSQSKKGPSVDDSVTFSHEVPNHDEEPEAQFSHITETVLDSDAPDPSLSDEAHRSETEATRGKNDKASVSNTKAAKPFSNDIEMINGDIAGNRHDHANSGQPEAHSPKSLTNKSTSVEVTLLNRGVGKHIVSTVMDNNREVGKHIASIVTDNEELTASDNQVSNPLVSDLIHAQLSGETVDSLPYAQIETSIFESKTASVPAVGSQLSDFKQTIADQSLGTAEHSMMNHVEDTTVQAAIQANETNGSTEESIENREDISAIFKEAGWSKDVPDSVLHDLYHDGMTSPDASLFEKLRQDMAEINQDVPYSPEFTGFGSSPPKINQKPAAKSPSSQGQSPAPYLPEPQQSPEASPQRGQGGSEPPRSGWHTVDENEDVDNEWEDEGDSSDGSDAEDVQSESSGEDDTTLPLRSEGRNKEMPHPVVESRSNDAEEANGTAKRIVEKGLSKSPAPSPKITKQKFPAKPAVKRKSKKLPRVSEFSNAEQIWNTMKQSPLKAVGPGQNAKDASPTMNLDGADERESNSVEHPKVSVNSSFTSQVTDHGRQPDFDFNDSTIIVGGNSASNLIAGLDEDNGNLQASKPTPKKISGKVVPPEKSTLLSRDIVDKRARRSHTKELSDDYDSDLPEIREIASQPLPKREKVSPFRRGPTLKKTEDTRAQSQGSNQSTPRKAKSATRRSESTKPPPRSSQLQKSQSQRQPYVPPAGTQITDLTISSDVEPDSPPKRTTPKRKARTYNIGEHDDEEWGGYVDGKERSEPRETRNGSVGLRNSSQTMLNMKGKRGGSR
jgi:hypothetical protein